MLTPEAAQHALGSAQLPSQRHAEPTRVAGARALAACARPSSPRRLLFADCLPDPRWASTCARRGIAIEAASTREALQKLGEPSPACLVLDADIGVEGHAALRAELAGCAGAGPVALLASAPALFSVMADWKDYGVAHVLLKPVELDELLAIVEPTGAPPAPRLPSLERLQREYIRAVLLSCEGNVSEAARQLGMYRQSLQRMLRRQSSVR